MNDLKIGDVLHGFCNGYFGRDDYSCKRVEVVAADYVVLRYLREDGVTILNGPINQKNINEWKSIDKNYGYQGCDTCQARLLAEDEAFEKRMKSQ
jgi:hypothetical protein